ncbi:MAG: WD40 repeat domain-containing protein [Bacteroidetes bacterium]|nr:WD40 repeat domain-containing protein [Bacteroidota bacterium]
MLYPIKKCKALKCIIVRKFCSFFIKSISLILYLTIFCLTANSQVTHQDKTLNGHEYTVLCLDIDKTGKYLVSGSYDTKVILWDHYSGNQLSTFQGHKSGVWNVKISPDNKYVASGSWDNNNNAIGSSYNCLNILDLKSLRLIKSLSVEPDRYNTLAMIPELDRSSANGIYKIFINTEGSKVAAITRGGDLFIWDIRNDFNRSLYNFKDTEHELLSLSPDWNYVVCCERKRTMADTSFYLLKLGTNEVIANFDNPKRSVIGAYFSSDSKHIVSISGDRIKRNEIDIWDVQTQELLFTLNRHSNVIRSIAFSNNDQYMASAGEDNLVNLWNIQTGKLIVSFSENNEKELTAVIFTPDQKYLISGSQDKTIKYWNIEEWIYD